ncbi:hypothetical protein VE04_06848 [Pseudogymnoascus sp. 24MN13]|nr:hypothetical protein VE04_06848 [Pseudogymnoascus sp. 24MN13]
MVDINSPSSPDTGQDATAAPGHGSDPKNMPPTNTSDAENMPPSNDHGHHEAEMKKTDQESDYEFADVSDPEEQYDFIMDKMMNMDEDQYQA